MHAPDSSRSGGLPQIAADTLARLRSMAPRVHCITNTVAQNFTANALLAVGALPSMTSSSEEIAGFVASAQGLLVNLGTFEPERRKATEIAITTASRHDVPWVLDPVLIDRAPPRAGFARELMARGPKVVRLNHAEFSVLSGAKPAADTLARYAVDHGIVVGLSGATDLVADGSRLAKITNGHLWMAKVTGTGCVASALTSACLAVDNDPWRATVAALLLLGVAGEVAAEGSKGPGSFVAAVIDALALLDGDTIPEAGTGDVMKLDLRVYALIDPQVSGGRKLADLAARVASGATLMQLRDKHGSTRAMVEEAREIQAALTSSRVPLLINDRVDVALAAEADGVHIGQDDMASADARLLLGRSAIIGLSIKTVAQAQAAPLEHLNYVAIGGVYATTSKDNTSTPIGLDGLRAIAAVIRARTPAMPICAIAGINGSNAADVIAAGADGVAVISALSLAADPAVAARDLRASVDAALEQRGRP